MHRVGRYIVADAIGKGGMATVHLARMIGPSGFGRILAVKRLHPHLTHDSELVVMLLDEAKIAARIQSPYVVPTLDVAQAEDELAIAMEYVHGVSLHRLLQRAKDREERPDPGIVAMIMMNVLAGLHAAHELTDESGAPMRLVHRDVSPQNILVGVDGVARILDFGVATALGRVTTTREGHVKGKISYMSPEQLQGDPVDRRTDVFAAAVVMWEALAGKRLFGGEDERSAIGKILHGTPEPPGTAHPALDAVVVRGLARDRDARFSTADEMARAIEEALTPAAPSKVGQWVEALADAELADRKRAMAALEKANVANPVRPDDDETKSSQALAVAPPPPRKDARWVVALAVGLLGALGIGTTFFLRERTSATAHDLATVTTPATAADAAAAPLVTASVAPSAPASIPAPSPSPPAPVVRATARPVASVTATTKPSASATIAAAAPDCTNPYELDEQGRRRYRRECLGSGSVAPPTATTTSTVEPPCPGPGLVRRCSGQCVNLQTDDRNCGVCGNVCPVGKHCDGHMFCRDAQGNL